LRRTRLGQGSRLTLSTKYWRYAWREYNEPEGRAVDRYGLEWNCPGEPYGFDLRRPGAAFLNPEYQKPRGNVPDKKQKGEARVERSFTLGVEAK